MNNKYLYYIIYCTIFFFFFFGFLQNFKAHCWNNCKSSPIFSSFAVSFAFLTPTIFRFSFILSVNLCLGCPLGLYAFGFRAVICPIIVSFWFPFMSTVPLSSIAYSHTFQGPDNIGFVIKFFQVFIASYFIITFHCFSLDQISFSQTLLTLFHLTLLPSNYKATG